MVHLRYLALDGWTGRSPLQVASESVRNHVYLDLVGVPTICFGHTKGVSLGDHMTDAQCAALLSLPL